MYKQGQSLPRWGTRGRQSPAGPASEEARAYHELLGIGTRVITAGPGVGSRAFPFSHLCKDPEGGRITKQVLSFAQEKIKMLSRKISVLFVSSSHRGSPGPSRESSPQQDMHSDEDLLCLQVG